MRTTRQIILVLTVLILVFLILILALDSVTPGRFILQTDFLQLLSDAEELKEFISQYEVLAPLVFFILQLVQVIISPIPGNVTTVIGGSLFGIGWGLLLNVTSIFLGSSIAFFLARKYGKPLVIRAIGKNIYKKYETIFEEKYVYTLFLIFLFPFFPDDALCLLAGISAIPTALFILLLVLGRLPGIMVGTFVGAGLMELTFREWIILGILLLIVLLFFLVYGKKVQKWLYKKIVEKRK